MFSASTRGRVRPIINLDTAFFWEGTQQGRLMVQQCASCGWTRHPPGPACPKCHSLDWIAVELPQPGTLYSYTVQHHPLPDGFESPCIVALIEFAGGIRIVSNIVDAEPDDLEIGEPLEVVFVDQEEGWTAPQFRRIAAG